MADKSPVRFSDLFRYWRGEPHQMAAVEMLGEEIPIELLGRDNEWFKVWSQSGKTPEASWLQPATAIIQKFEGCRLNAYLCPAGVWTIGWGATEIDRRPVKNTDSISQAQADLMLQNEIERVANSVLKAIPSASSLTGNQIAALISWTFNVGIGAMAESTLRTRLLNGDDPKTVIQQELPKWNKANGKPLDGLTIRREAEIDLFCGQKDLPKQPAKINPSSSFDTRLTPNISLGEFALYQEARRFDNQRQVDVAAELAAFLEKVRIQFGGNPLIITSGYRPSAINAAVGGAENSEHLYDAIDTGAVDFYVQSVDILKVQDWCDKNWPYSIGYGAPKGFVHLGMRTGRPRVRWIY